MEKFRKRPNGNYIQKADWREIYALTQNWKSELLFYIDERRFFRKLIGNYMERILNRENLDAVREVKMILLEIDKKIQDLLRKTNKHLEQLALMVEDPKRKDARIFRMEHEHLEDEITDFENNFSTLRKDVFAVIESMMQSEKMAGLNLKSNEPINA